MFVTTYQGSVNRWECDENDHLNVRFYVDKIQQGLLIGLQKLCLLEHANAGSGMRCLRVVHLRFLREAAVATPITIEVGLVEQGLNRLVLLAAVRRTGLPADLATAVCEFDLTDSTEDWLPGEAHVAVPDHAKPRGIPGQTSIFAEDTFSEALARGFRQVGSGVIADNECNQHDELEPYRYMGRLSDAMPNFWAQFQSEDEIKARGQGILGGAVLEYRLEYHHPITCGSAFAHLAGLSDIGNKTQHIQHLLFNAGTGQCCLSAQALGIQMDLVARKSIPISPAQRNRFSALLIKPSPVRQNDR